MRALLQRVAEAAVEFADRPPPGAREPGEREPGEPVSGGNDNPAGAAPRQTATAIGAGLVVFLCAMRGDTPQDLDYIVRKVAELRVFADEQGLMNLSVAEVGGALLVVSQFTLAAATRKGRRPSFIEAAASETAEPTIAAAVAAWRARGLTVATGRFGAHMRVRLTNDGPVTLWLDSRQR